MALGTHEQFHTLVAEKKHVLITTAAHVQGDGIASALALSLFLDAIEVRSDIVIAGFTGHGQYAFLPKFSTIQPKFSYLKKFILQISTKDKGVKELSYDVKDDLLRIFVTPEHGEISREDITTSSSIYKYDAIVVLDSDDLVSLGSLYTDHTTLFLETPLICIAHSPTTEHFGNINIIDITASSTAEVLFELFQTIGKEHISEVVAESLLTGMISKTNSFKSKEIAPKSLTAASKLMKLGADRDRIIDMLYRTRTIHSLKLWGEALTHMQYDSAYNLVWTSITREAFVRSGATESDLEGLVPELISSSPSAQVIIILHEHPKESTIHGIVYSKPGIDSRDLVKAYNPSGTSKAAQFYMRDKSLKEVEERIMIEIRAQL